MREELRLNQGERNNFETHLRECYQSNQFKIRSDALMFWTVYLIGASFARDINEVLSELTWHLCTMEEVTAALSKPELRFPINNEEELFNKVHQLARLVTTDLPINIPESAPTRPTTD